MNEDKNIDTLEDAARAAIQAEAEAKAEPDAAVYVHRFKKPFTWKGRTYEQLTFDWGPLTGTDYLEIENELMLMGKTLITPAYCGDFLCGMAARACAELKADVMTRSRTLRALPLRDFQIITRRARDFLLRAE